jgi:acetyl-CoA acyltransferase
MNAVIVTGCRTPFIRSQSEFKKLSAIDLGKVAVREAVARSGIDPRTVDQLVFGTVVHDVQAPNIAREVGLATLPETVPAWTVSRACASSNQAIADGVNLIRTGYAHTVVAGGSESLTHIPITLTDPLAQALMEASRSRTAGARLRAFRRIRPRDLLPVAPQIAEPTTGETMGAATERMAKENGITRADQDAWALRSHRLALAGTGDGRLLEEVAPVYLPPEFERVVDRDNGLRSDTTLDALSKLRPVFDRRHGSITAGNASPLTDGASAVVLMSEERAKEEGLSPIARIRSYAWAAVDPGGQLLQGPAYAAPIALDRAGVAMSDIGLLEIHEAFAAQVLSNLQALGSLKFAEAELGRSRPVGLPPEDRINVMGGSIAIGHPFGATGGRITMTLANEMRRRDVELGLLTVCAAGGMGFAMVLERV